MVDNNEIIGAISIVPNNEMDDIPLWKNKDNACEIARIVISKKHQGKGLAKTMVEYIFPICIHKGFTSIHLSCQRDNIPANKTYHKLGFEKVGEKYIIHGYKQNGKLYNTWDEAVFLGETDAYYVFGNNKTEVTKRYGKSWHTKESAVMFYFKNEWFNVIAQLKKNGIFYN